MFLRKIQDSNTKRYSRMFKGGKVHIDFTMYTDAHIMPTSLFYYMNGLCFKIATNHKEMLLSMPNNFINCKCFLTKLSGIDPFDLFINILGGHD